MDFQQRLEEDGFAEKLVFSDEVTFHVCGKVNCHNIRIWCMENPQAIMQHVRDLSKVNVFSAISSCKVYRLFFFAEPTVTDINYLDMLQLWLMPQLQEDSVDFIFQQDRALPHSILMCVLTSMIIFLVVGLGALLTMTPLFFPGHHSHLT